MKSKYAFVLLAIAVVVLGCTNCGYVGRYADRQCADAMAGKIAESTASFELVPSAEARRVLSDDEKKILFSKIRLPSCESGTKDLEKKYQVALTGSGNQFFRVDVWLTGEKPKISD